MKDFEFTSESVGDGHPDKVCDRISDGVLDAILKYDEKKGLKPYKMKDGDARGSRCACETFISLGLVIVGGEITTDAWVDVRAIVKQALIEIGYTGSEYGFDYRTCAILNVIGAQSPDIAQGVDCGGAGDQGIMFGYACDETENLMPAPLEFSHALVRKFKEVRASKEIPYLGPDCKSQVTVKYVDDKPVKITKVVVSSQHTSEVVEQKGARRVMKQLAREEIIEKVVKASLPADLLKGLDFKKDCFVNPTGIFLVGGPQSDTGVTGRKIIVDTYGGMIPHGGGAFSGKDPSKVDRSASYAARYVAKNIVAAGLAKKCILEFSYAIGVAEPMSVWIDTKGTSVIPEEEIIKLVRDEEIFQLTPSGIVNMLDLWHPIYRATAAYGHFGRKSEGKTFPWEKTDKVTLLKKKAGV
ncbi:MAG: methionine adenosyltransferase [Elusimicrobia bacterium CG03_land_8_20_14_0_80_50_18]|nr:MAG: methionine adenosyltransferase [Elusimicrobia bacterium CG03_land_8_20_14_0_80_50_18]